MATAPRGRSSPRDQPCQELHSGDRMQQAEFHRIYEMMPEGFKAELIGGVVYVASPLKQSHGRYHLALGSIIYMYAAGTPGVDAFDNTTVIIGDKDEVQPDLCLRIRPECGGQSRGSDDEYIEGAPELVIEIAYSSRAIDLHAKRRRYKKAGVNEYIVHCLQPPEMLWFDFCNEQRIAPDSDDVLRSVVFPGLWLNARAVLDMNGQLSIEILNRGLATKEHRDFVTKLEEEHL